MGKALKQTPTAWVWETAISLAYLLAGVMLGLMSAAGGRSAIVLDALVVGVVAIVFWAAAKKAEWVASTPVGRWWWHVAIWFCADGVIEREEMLAKTDGGFDDDR